MASYNILTIYPPQVNVASPLCNVSFLIVLALSKYFFVFVSLVQSLAGWKFDCHGTERFYSSFYLSIPVFVFVYSQDQHFTWVIYQSQSRFRVALYLQSECQYIPMSKYLFFLTSQCLSFLVSITFPFSVSLLLATLLNILPNSPDAKIFRASNNSSSTPPSSSGKMNLCVDLLTKVFYSVGRLR